MATQNIRDLSQKSEISNERERYFRPRYIRSLDGIRGILILLVLLTHLDVVGSNVGFIAVDCFFVLSGFLITWLLVTECNDSGTVNLEDFYYRRALRLLPALFTMLASFAVYTCLTSPPDRVAKDFRCILEAVFYFSNWGQIFWPGERETLLAHTWSLSIEEQFYLLWAPILLLLLRRTGSRTSLLWWTIFGALFLAFMRAVYVELDNPVWSNYWRLARGLDTRADSLLMGCAAGIVVSGQFMPRRRWLGLGLLFAAVMSIFGLIWLALHYEYDPWMYSVGWFLASLFSVIVIVYLVFSPRGILHWILEFSPLVYIGMISYGLYVWHFPIFRTLQTHHLHHWQLTAVPIAAAATLLSYYLVERPCLRLKKRFYRKGKQGQPADTQIVLSADG